MLKPLLVCAAFAASGVTATLTYSGLNLALPTLGSIKMVPDASNAWSWCESFNAITVPVSRTVTVDFDGNGSADQFDPAFRVTVTDYQVEVLGMSNGVILSDGSGDRWRLDDGEGDVISGRFSTPLVVTPGAPLTVRLDPGSGGAVVTVRLMGRLTNL